MDKYEILLNILDRLRSEGYAAHPKLYGYGSDNQDHIAAARSRSFIHFYLKVGFGLTEFVDREHFVTDGSYDGGIDGYYIHTDAKIVFFIQSKFRITADNFDNKKIELSEILKMDIDRVLRGEFADESGNEYNGKIKQLQREISEVDDIGRYSYRVILLANVGHDISLAKLKTLVGGTPVEVFNYERCYAELVFPMITGTYYNATDLRINIDLSNKNAGSKISYGVQTKHGDCEITVLFVPTIEIAKILNKYKNAILKFNPRSYLELEGNKVNVAIRETILNESTNEFALYNNGITMISDETYINERIGQKNKAQLIVRNPQIINGGQTAYTLGRILQEQLNSGSLAVFEGKEVLIKVITVFHEDRATAESDFQNLDLIENISTATNQQTAVQTADKFSNETFHKSLQKILFDRYGILYERKRGEFSDGVNEGYMELDQLLERNLFFRILYACRGQIEFAAQKKLFLRQKLDTLPSNEELDEFYFAFLYYRLVVHSQRLINYKDRGLYGRIYVFTKKYRQASNPKLHDYVETCYPEFKKEWEAFISAISKRESTRFKKISVDKAGEQLVSSFNMLKWTRSGEFKKDIESYFFSLSDRVN